MSKFVIASLNRKGNLVFVNRYYGGTAKTSENIEDAKIYYSPYDAQEEWKDRMGDAKITLGLKDGNFPFIVSVKQVMNKFVIASLNRKGNLVFVNRYYGGTAKTSENIEDAKIYYSPYDAKEEWDDRMRGAKITLGLKDGNTPFIVSINQVMNKTI